MNKGINYENQVVTFEWQREGKKLCIRQQRLTPEVPVTDALASSVADNYINPLIASLKIEAVAPDSSTVVVKIDELFNGKQTGLNDVFNNINLGTSANADLSRILDIKAFESNITATSELTTIVREGMSKVNVTVVVSSSLSLLPETPMRGRKESKRSDISRPTASATQTVNKNLKPAATSHVGVWNHQTKPLIYAAN